jgi:eukaryotic-like serine/threonine-protein kinase
LEPNGRRPSAPAMARRSRSSYVQRRSWANIFANRSRFRVAQPSHPRRCVLACALHSQCTTNMLAIAEISRRATRGGAATHLSLPGPRAKTVDAPLREGDLVGDVYRVEALIGEGGMGLVFAARHVALGHAVAIKCLRPAAYDHQDVRARFHWEARAGRQIRSEHVARVMGEGTLEGGAPYIVMELLDGIDLGRFMEQRKDSLAVEEAVDYILQACDGLSKAHAAGIVHRDLKPENLFLTRRADGSTLVKVIDFGVSSFRELASWAEVLAATSGPSALLGSPAYMSPEQVRCFEKIDARADVWSLGVILYELLTGSLVYGGTSLAVILKKIRDEPPVPARARRAGLPVALDDVILRCLEKDPDRRFQSVVDLARALIPFAANKQRGPAIGSGTNRRTTWT